MPELDGKVAVVTGGNRGIGREIAGALVAAGAAVTIASRDEATLNQTAGWLRESGAECLAVPCDVVDERSVSALRDAVLDRFGRVDAVIANAGTTGPTQPMHEMSLADWRDCVAANLDGVFLTFRAFVPALVQRGGGSLIAISSMTGKRPLAGRTPYAAAKLGVVGLCRTLAAELGPHGVRVNSICPGAVDGPRIRNVIREQARTQGMSEEEAGRQLFTGPAPLQRLVDPGEIARTCVFLASDASSGITGEDVNVSAGVVMY
ncbi:MAG: SDR family oxidoreductase [Candidatus Dormibacteraeota bacterium]|nr:SDR family oxidoreductase [Candidatus Dormibacteraeota bacterium]